MIHTVNILPLSTSSELDCVCATQPGFRRQVFLVPWRGRFVVVQTYVVLGATAVNLEPLPREVLGNAAQQPLRQARLTDTHAIAALWQLPEAMAPTIEAVRNAGADLGIVLDTDVDRSGVVDKTGEAINRNRLIAFLATVVLRDNPGTTIVTDSTTSNGLKVRFFCIVFQLYSSLGHSVDAQLLSRQLSKLVQVSWCTCVLFFLDTLGGVTVRRTFLVFLVLPNVILRGRMGYFRSSVSVMGGQPLPLVAVPSTAVLLTFSCHALPRGVWVSACLFWRGQDVFPCSRLMYTVALLKVGPGSSRVRRS